MAATPNRKIWLPGIENGKLFLGCAIVAAVVVVGGSLGAETKAENEISANQVSLQSVHPYGLINQEKRGGEESAVFACSRADNSGRLRVVKPCIALFCRAS